MNSNESNDQITFFYEIKVLILMNETVKFSFFEKLNKNYNYLLYFQESFFINLNSKLLVELTWDRLMSSTRQSRRLLPLGT